MIDEPESSTRPNNLYSPGDDDRDHGAHGAFDDRATSRSLEFELNKKRGWIPAGAAALLVGLAIAGRR